MIQVNEGKVIIKGATPVVWAELEHLLSSFRGILEENYDKERVEEIFNMIVEDSKKSDEELKKQANDLLKDILKTIMEGLGE